MTWDEWLHWFGGFFKALPHRRLTYDQRVAAAQAIDRYGWNREVAQHDETLTPHQVAEARAWGKGARAALRVVTAWPSPPYPS